MSLPCPTAAKSSPSSAVTPTGSTRRDIAAAGVGKVADVSHIRGGRRGRRTVRISDDVAAYIVDIARATRESPSLAGREPSRRDRPLRTSGAWAWLNGRDFVTPDDVKALAHGSSCTACPCDPRPSSTESPSAGPRTAFGSVPVPR